MSKSIENQTNSKTQSTNENIKKIKSLSSDCIFKDEPTRKTSKQKQTKTRNYQSFIGPWQFRNSRIKEITIPSNIVKIANGAFRNCKRLTTVIFTNDSKIQSIGVKAFYGCYALKTIILPKKKMLIYGKEYDLNKTVNIELLIKELVGPYHFGGGVGRSSIPSPNSAKSGRHPKWFR